MSISAQFGSAVSANQETSQGNVGFEPSLDRLEEIVHLLEEGKLPLEESLTLFEEGVGLSRHCLDVLGKAERKVEMLMTTKGATVPLDSPADSDDAGLTP
jgi:exodeoxyribonuclease VII small subunit